MILSKNATGKNGTKEKVGKNGALELNFPKTPITNPQPPPQTLILKLYCVIFTYFSICAIITCAIFTWHQQQQQV